MLTAVGRAVLSSMCQATWKTDPQATGKTDPLTTARRGHELSKFEKLSAAGSAAGGRDAGAGRRRGHAALESARLGHEADRRGVGLQPQHGEALPGDGWLGGLPEAG